MNNFKKYIFAILTFFLQFNFVYAIECKYVPVASVDEIGNYTAPNLDYSLPDSLDYMKDYWIKLDTYNSGTGHSSIGGDEDVVNWDGKKYCPNVIRVENGMDTEWYGYEDLESALKASQDARYTGLFNDGGDYNNYDKFLMLDSYRDKLKLGLPSFDKNVEYTCEYDYFTIDYNKDGYALSAKSTIGSSTSALYDYSLSNKMIRTPAQKPGECETVRYCLSNSVAGTTPVYYYTIFVDSFDADENKEECEDNILLGRSESVLTGEYDNSCRTYVAYYEELKSLWNESETDFNKRYEYNKLKDKVSSLCRSLTQYANYGDDECLLYCLNYSNDIYEIEKIKFSSDKCGFSERLILWIANIVRWVKYIAPVLVIVLGILDFIKAVSSDKDDEMKKSQGRFVKRLIVASLIFLTPFIIEFILNVFGFEANGCGIIDL